MPQREREKRASDTFLFDHIFVKNLCCLYYPTLATCLRRRHHHPPSDSARSSKYPLDLLFRDSTSAVAPDPLQPPGAAKHSPEKGVKGVGILNFTFKL
jgi:hypothetical protein